MEWLTCICCVFFGAVLLLLIQVFLVICYIWNTPAGNPIPTGDPPEFRLPKSVEHIGLYSDNGDCAAALSLTLQFLFQELKHAPAPLAWIHRKLHQEMVDLLTRTTSGKLFESLTVRSISTGDSAPCIRWAGVQNVETYSEGRIKTLDLLLDIYYSGGFRLAVDAGILLGKTACFDIEVEQLSGRARIRFTTQPFTHWSLAFLSPPQLELCARPLKGRLAALLQAHARRALQKRHTLPNYSIRFKPFFTKIDSAQLEMPIEDTSFKLQGKFEITVIEITRLFTDVWQFKENPKVYCSVCIDSNTWISCRQDHSYFIFTLDIVVNKDKTQQLGTVFKQVVCDGENKSKTQVVIETVVPLSAAYRADLRRDDVILAVDNKLVSSMNQVAKAVKNVSRPCFTIRIERKTKKSSLPEFPSYNDDLKRNSKPGILSPNDGSTLKQDKNNTFSFRKMSDVLDSARSVGQEGRALLRNAHSNWNIQDLDKKPDVDNMQDNKSLSISKSQIKIDDSNTYSKSLTTSSTSGSLSKQSDTTQSQSFSFGLRKRRCSVENKTSSDSSTSSTPTASSPGTPSKRNEKLFNRDRNKSSFEDSSNAQTKQEPPKICVSNSNEIGQKNYDANGSKDSSKDQNVNSVDQTNSKTKEKDEKALDDENNGHSFFQNLQTNLMPLSEIIICQEVMSFKLNQNHRFININVWGNNSDNAQDILLGYLNIPLLTILNDCYNSKISQFQRKFTLLPPDVNLTVSKTHPLSSHHGFEPCLCYGDILLSCSWLNENSSSAQSKLSNLQSSKNTQESDKDCPEDFEILNSNVLLPENIIKSSNITEDIPKKAHNFLRTHFHRSTQCDFCSKKIWLKDAVQCRDCALCCHKKCVTKCLNSGYCQPPTLIQQGETFISKPQFLMTEHSDDGDYQNPNYAPDIANLSKEEIPKSDENLLGQTTLTGLLGGLRRVGSAHSLSPSSHSPSSARSLPPSPQHTPRCQSPDDDIAWTAFEVAIEKGVKNTDDLLKPLIAAQIPLDVLLSKAKDSGPRLLVHLPPEIRAERITTLIADVKVALDKESKNMVELQNSMKNMTTNERTDTKLLLEQREEKTQILTALLLHCCSAMQSASK